MDSENSNKFSFNDEKIKKVGEEAFLKGKAKFESQQDMFNRINNIPTEKDSSENKKEASSPIKSGGSPVEEGKAAEEPQNKSSEKYPIKNLRTYQGDIAEAIKNKNASVISITLAEKKKQAEKEKKEPKVKKKNTETLKHIATISISIFLIVLGVAAVVGFYLLQKNPPVDQPILAIDETIAPFDKKVTHNISQINRNALSEIIKSLKSEPLGAGEIVYIALVKQVNELERSASPEDFFEAVKVKVPGNLLRSFNDNIMVGLQNVGTTEPFILIGLSSFENAYAGMFDWEKTIYSDLGIFFSRNTLRVSNQTENASTSTSTGSVTFVTTDPEIKQNFEDITLRNKDARVLKNSRGDIVLLYSFVDRDTILITSDTSVLREMVNKINSSKLIR